MELKPYQQQVINDLFLFPAHIQETKDTREAFHDFWAKHPRAHRCIDFRNVHKTKNKTWQSLGE